MMLKRWPLIILIVIAAGVHFWNLGQPAEVVFDEVHYGKSVSAYFTREFFVDGHPPLSKLMIASAAWAFGFHPGFDFDHIGEPYDAQKLFALRFLVALFGVIFVAVVYEFILALRLSRWSAFAGAFLVLFDNALLVESRFALINIFLLSFGFAALIFFIQSTRTNNIKKERAYFAIASALAGLAISVKWIGVLFLGLILLFTAIRCISRYQWKKCIVRTLGALIIVAILYTGFMAIHLKLQSKSGPGDWFMTKSFQKTLIGNAANYDTTISPLGFWSKFLEMNVVLYKYHANLTIKHPDSSTWYEWPFMKRPIFYWVKYSGDNRASIYFVGNPLVWWPAGLAVFLSVVFLFRKKLRKAMDSEISLLLIGYFASILPFIGIARVAFLYHYLIPLVFSICIFILLAERVFTAAIRNKNIIRIIYGGWLVCVFFAFLVLAPLTYGLMMPSSTNTQYNSFIDFLRRR